METNRKRTSGASSFSQRVKEIIKKIPRGKVATYGQIAAYAGSPRAVRQVVWILNSSSRKDKLPWHRVINRQGRISLKPNQGYEVQKMLLKKEGVKFEKKNVIDFERYLWFSISGSRRL
jgi:methylated-DNA-protein-cysteine methyltransferase-like protein